MGQRVLYTPFEEKPQKSGLHRRLTRFEINLDPSDSDCWTHATAVGPGQGSTVALGIETAA